MHGDSNVLVPVLSSIAARKKLLQPGTGKCKFVICVYTCNTARAVLERGTFRGLCVLVNCEHYKSSRINYDVI